MSKKTNKLKIDSVINHPTITIADLKKRGKKVDKKSRTNGVKARVIDILKTNTAKGIGLTQRQIKTALNDEVREQHINNILQSLKTQNKIDRYERSIVCNDGVRRDLMVNVWLD